MEYCEHGDLHGYLSSVPPLPEVQAREIIFQTLEGVRFMHENEFAHRDLKPNVCSLDSFVSEHGASNEKHHLEYPYQISTARTMVGQDRRLWHIEANRRKLGGPIHRERHSAIHGA